MHKGLLPACESILTFSSSTQYFKGRQPSEEHTRSPSLDIPGLPVSLPYRANHMMIS